MSFLYTRGIQQIILTKKIEDSGTSIFGSGEGRHWCLPYPAFLAHLSWKLRGAILIAFCPSSVCLSVNFYIFNFFSKTTGPILTKLGTNHPWGEGFQVCSNERDCLSPRGDNSERVKMHWKILKTSMPNSIKLGINYTWVKGI
jgi:hypothetical protein